MAGISILRRLLLKEAVKGSGQASGIMSIGDNVRKLAEKRLQSYLLSAQKQGVDLDKLGEQEIRYMLEMNKPKAPRVISQDDPEFVSFRDQILGKKNRDNVIQGKFGKPFKEEIGSVDNVINNITRMEPVAAMKEVNKVLRREGKYKNLSKQDSEKVFNDTDDWINQRDPADLYDYKNKRPFREDPNFDPDDPDFDPEDMADGGRIGFFMGGQFPKGLATLRQMLNYYGKKSDAVKNPSDILKIVNPKQFNRLLEDPRIYRKFDVEKGIGAPELIKILQKQMMGERKKTIEEMLSSAKNIKKLDDDALKYKNDMIEDMMKKGVDRGMAEEMATTMSRLTEDMVGKFKDTPKLTDEGILELENVLKNMETGGKKKTELNADGGRIGLKDGMNRRTFLKLFTGLVSLPIIGKVLKPLKTVKGVKNVPIIKTDNVAGKPEWFDQLVNKVIIEGDDVTRNFQTKEREIVHAAKIDEDNYVRVTQDLDEGTVRVEYDSDTNVFGDTVQLQYKKPLPDEGNPRPTAEFTTAESGPVGRSRGPDDYEIDVDEVGGGSIRDLDSDVSKLKEYATGKKLTIKEIVESKKRRDRAKDISDDPEAQSDAIIRRQGEYDGPYEDDFASGGIAGMLGE